MRPTELADNRRNALAGKDRGAVPNPGRSSAAVEGEALALGGERQRASLAVLLANANEMVSTERLIEHLFGQRRAALAGRAASC